MYKYYKFVQDGYILGIMAGDCDKTEITESEYNEILAIIHTVPTAPAGYGYRLKTDLTWELYELPPMPPDDEDATEDDYQNQLERLGVDV